MKNAMPGSTTEKASKTLFGKAKDAFKELEKSSKYLKQVRKSGHTPGEITRRNVANAKKEVWNVVKSEFKNKFWYKSKMGYRKKGYKYAKKAFFAACPLLDGKGQLKGVLKALSPIYKENKDDTAINYIKNYNDSLQKEFDCVVEGTN